MFFEFSKVSASKIERKKKVAGQHFCAFNCDLNLGEGSRQCAIKESGRETLIRGQRLVFKSLVSKKAFLRSTAAMNGVNELEMKVRDRKGLKSQVSSLDLYHYPRKVDSELSSKHKISQRLAKQTMKVIKN